MHATAIGKVAYNDVLTGLYNRTAYTDKIKEIGELEKRTTTIGVVMFDVNNLKYVNDNLGHNYGDELIMAASQVIKESFDDSVTIYRIGGDEFLGIIESDNARQIYKLASIQFKTLMHNYNITYHKPFHLSIAIGEAFLEKDSKEDISEIIEDADKKMYADKQEYKKTHSKVEK